MAFLDRALRAVGLRTDVQVAVGQPAPDFTLNDSDGQAVTLSEAVKQGPVMLAFFPRAFTSGCSHELKTYTEEQPLLAGKGVQLFAISVDNQETLARFRTSLKAPFRFLSDPEGKVAARYGGVTSGQANRITVTVGPDRLITRITPGLPAIFPRGDIDACRSSTR